MDPLAEVRERYRAAVDALATRLEQDQYVLAAVLYGSVARGEAWARSDIDLIIVLRDDQTREERGLWLVENEANVAAFTMPRSRFKRLMEGALQGSFGHSIRSQYKLLFSKDAAIASWLVESDRVGARDQAFQLLRLAATVVPILDKAEKWFYVKDDLHYSLVWILYAVNELARIEVVMAGKVPGREAIQQALGYNPEFFRAVYSDLLDGPCDRQAIQEALDRLNAYVLERVDRLFQPVLDYLAEADGVRTASEMDAYFKKKVQTDSLFWAYEWLARQGVIHKAAAPLRLTKKSQVTLDEPAYFYEQEDPTDWE